MNGTALVLTAGLLDTHKAKTAHGLIRGTERYEILGVIDEKHAGKDAGEVLDGEKRGIPVHASLSNALEQHQTIDFIIVGVATKGGVLPSEMKETLLEAISHGISPVSGLHQFLSDDPELSRLAAEKQVALVDVRKPKTFADLHFWSGKIAEVTCPKVAVLGTDCNLGKRTTALFLTEAAKAANLKAEMVYTGQTGWMQGSKYGFIFDATLNDFISGELEHAIHECWVNEKPDIIFLEGQSALRNPSGPCGSEYIISADATAVILQHAPEREYFHGCEGYKQKIPTLKQEVELIKIYGADTIAITLNTKGIALEKAREYQHQFEAELGIPVILPIEDGHARLTSLLKKFMEQK